MRRVYKFPVYLTDTFFVDMPKGAEVLTVQTQDDVPYIWAIVETDSPKVSHEFHLRGTGHVLDGDEGRYVGTFQLDEGRLVFHLFEDITLTDSKGEAP